MRIFAASAARRCYPSRTKDSIPVDFSTGSVGLGVAITLFASLVQDYLTAHGWMDEQDRGRFVALIGDAELDEGNIYEALIEGAKHDVRNLWWIVDYNRQSLDATTADRMFGRFDEIFASCGWRVETLKYGKLLEAAFLEPAARRCSDWIDAAQRRFCGAHLSRRHGLARAAARGRSARRRAIPRQAQRRRAGAADDQSRRPRPRKPDEAFDAPTTTCPTLFIAYTIKGFGLPFAGHKDNHAGLMNPTQIAALRESMGISEGQEWEPLEGVGGNARPASRRCSKTASIAREKRRRGFGGVSVPAIPAPAGDEQSTQAAFGRILLDLSKAGGELADRIVTTSPDVTVSTNLGAWVNQRGLFRRREMADVFAQAKIASAQKWSATTKASTSSSASPRTTCS